MKKIAIMIIVILTAVLLFGCSSGSTNSSNSTPTKLSLSLSQSTASIPVGSNTLKLSATESNGTGNIVWTSENDTIATVNTQGVVLGNNPGTTNIVATVSGSDVSAACSVTVTGKAEITLSQYTMSVFVGDPSVQLIATTALPGTIAWSSSDPTVASVDSSGNIHFIGSGIATITASVGGVSASCVVQVTTPTLTISPVSIISDINGTPIQLNAVANAPGAVTWTTSDASIATVDSSGKVSFVGVGQTIITATQVSTGLVAKCNVTVNPGNFNISQTSISAYTTSSPVQLSVTSTVQGGLAWSSSNASIATVDSSGKVSFVGVGTATITVTQASTHSTAMCTVTVQNGTITLSQTSLSAYTTSSAVQLKATCVVMNGMTWSSSNTSVATVDSSGKVSFVGVGTATITVSQPLTSATATCTVTVQNGAITLSQTSLSAYTTNSAMQLSVTTAVSGTVSWSSSNTSVATVDSSGKVTFVGVGTATITVSQPLTSATATCTVTVQDGSIRLSQTSITAFMTTSPVQLYLYESVTSAGLQWKSSNTSVATVDAAGAVSFVGVGTATITVTQPLTSATASCVVTVKPGTIALSQTNITVYPGQLYINTVAHPTVPGDIKFSSSDSNEVSVSPDGMTCGLNIGASLGTATITATQPSTVSTGTCQVNVVNEQYIPSMNSIVGGVGKTFNVTVTGNTTWAYMADAVGNTNTNYFTISNIQEGDNTETFQVTIFAAGTGGSVEIQDKFSGYVLNIPVTGESVTINTTNPSISSMMPSEQLSVTTVPANANLVWTSSNTNVITVSSTGLIRQVARNQGASTITATTADGQASASCTATAVDVI